MSDDYTHQRVIDCTPTTLTAEIGERTKDNIEYFLRRSRFDIDRRLEELDREWTVERAFEASTSGLLCLSVVLGTNLGGRAPLTRLLPFLLSGSLLERAVFGWTRPMSLFRRLGLRTRKEVHDERLALKAVHGDFAGLDEETDPELKAAEVYESALQ